MYNSKISIYICVLLIIKTKKTMEVKYTVKKEKDSSGEPVAVLYKNINGEKIKVHSVDLYSNYSFREAKRDLLRANN